jgi:hemerythrin-like metal-binding protein
LAIVVGVGWVNKFELSTAFMIGHEKIDSDHASLVENLNEMSDAFVAGNVEGCLKEWQKFIAQLDQHFIDESEIMESFGFAEFGYIRDEHEDDHQKILARVKSMGKKNNTLDDWEACLFDMRNDLLSWILKHDLLFAEHLITIGYNEV